MTRAKEELYLCHARLREFRGQTLYAVPSMFLEELPRGGRREHRPVGQRRAARQRAMEDWRGAPGGGSKGWNDAGIPLPTTAKAKEDSAPPRPPPPSVTAKACWSITRHMAAAASPR